MKTVRSGVGRENPEVDEGVDEIALKGETCLGVGTAHRPAKATKPGAV